MFKFLILVKYILLRTRDVMKKIAIINILSNFGVCSVASIAEINYEKKKKLSSRDRRDAGSGFSVVFFSTSSSSKKNFLFFQFFFFCRSPPRTRSPHRRRSPADLVEQTKQTQSSAAAVMQSWFVRYSTRAFLNRGKKIPVCLYFH